MHYERDIGDTIVLWIQDPGRRTGIPAGETAVRLFHHGLGWFLDWNDLTFKAASHTTISQTLAQLDATNAPGYYSRSLDLSTLTNGRTPGDRISAFLRIDATTPTLTLTDVDTFLLRPRVSRLHNLGTFAEARQSRAVYFRVVDTYGNPVNGGTFDVRMSKNRQGGTTLVVSGGTPQGGRALAQPDTTNLPGWWELILLQADLDAAGSMTFVMSGHSNAKVPDLPLQLYLKPQGES